jgi:hypothetical protein
MPRLPLFLRGGLLVLGLSLVLLLGPAARAEDLEVAGGTVRWDPGLSTVGHEVAALLPSVRKQVASLLGWPLGDVDVDIAVVQDLDGMRREARAAVPAWAVGVAISARALIVLRADLLRAGVGGGIGPVLRHEWVHLSWGRRSGTHRRDLPLWAEEGLAEQIGGGVSVDAGAALDLAVRNDTLIPFDDLREAFPDDAYRADLAYRESRSWIAYLVEREGWAALRSILDDLARGPQGPGVAPTGDRFDEIVRRVTGLGLSQWHAAWMQSVRDRAAPWWRLLFRDIPYALLMFVAVVGLLSFAFLVRHRRRQIAALPDDAALGPPFGEGQGEA